jgi:hypothetical protein
MGTSIRYATITRQRHGPSTAAQLIGREQLQDGYVRSLRFHCGKRRLDGRNPQPPESLDLYHERHASSASKLAPRVTSQRPGRSRLVKTDRVNGGAGGAERPSQRLTSLLRSSSSANLT